jgi:hypothetical protein
MLADSKEPNFILPNRTQSPPTKITKFFKINWEFRYKHRYLCIQSQNDI